MKETDNEITVRILCNKNELISLLENEGCVFDVSFRLDDTYYLKDEINKKSNVRELLKQAIIERLIIDDNNTTKQLMYKVKDIDAEGTIISQEKYSLDIVDENEVENFLGVLGYKKTIRLIEDDIIYKYNGIGIVIKDVKDMGLMMEIETRANSIYNTIDNLKALVDELNIPIAKDDYFIKKAEIALQSFINK